MTESPATVVGGSIILAIVFVCGALGLIWISSGASNQAASLPKLEPHYQSAPSTPLVLCPRSLLFPFDSARGAGAAFIEACLA